MLGKNYTHALAQTRDSSKWLDSQWPLRDPLTYIPSSVKQLSWDWHQLIRCPSAHHLPAILIFCSTPDHWLLLSYTKSHPDPIFPLKQNSLTFPDLFIFLPFSPDNYNWWLTESPQLLLLPFAPIFWESGGDITNGTLSFYECRLSSGDTQKPYLL